VNIADQVDRLQRERDVLREQVRVGANQVQLLSKQLSGQTDQCGTYRVEIKNANREIERLGKSVEGDRWLWYAVGWFAGVVSIVVIDVADEMGVHAMGRVALVTVALLLTAMVARFIEGRKQ
jgi:hypothetical protein